MKLPALIVNFKSYRKGIGKKAFELSKVCEKVSKSTGVNIAVVPQFTDLRMISKDIDVEVFSQHIDPVNYGSNTGHVLPEAVKKSGASGTLLNHSERRIDQVDIEKGIKRAKELDMETLVCVQNVEEAEKVSNLKPDYIAYEPPELIGGDISVSQSKPDILRRAVKKIKSIDKSIEVLTGAGIKTSQDVKKALELGTKGVLVASGIIKADKPKKALKELVKGFS